MQAAPGSGPARPPPAAEPAMPLPLARTGGTFVIDDIRGGAGLRHHLAEMGLGIGARLKIETGGRNGPLVVRAQGARLVLGRAMVDRIYVRPAPGVSSDHDGA